MSYVDDIQAAAIRYGVDPSIALAVAQRESGINPNAIGSAGEIGIFQVMPGTAAGLGIDPGQMKTDPQLQIDAGIRYLAEQYQRFGTWDMALAAYNAGPGRAASGNIPASTQDYISWVLGKAQELAGTLAEAITGESNPLDTSGSGAGGGGLSMLAVGVGVGALVYLLIRPS